MGLWLVDVYNSSVIPAEPIGRPCLRLHRAQSLHRFSVGGQEGSV